MKIAIDSKNTTLYKSGISYWVRNFLQFWIDNNLKIQFIHIIPNIKKMSIEDTINSSSCKIFWPFLLPKSFRHFLYDNLFFPLALIKMKPDLIFSPYYDVRLCKNIPSIITVHDLCFLEVGYLYPWYIRHYYLYMLKLNLRIASHVITVSQTSRLKLIKLLNISPSKISVVGNGLDAEFLNNKTVSHHKVCKWKASVVHNSPQMKLILYTGGYEYRKNLLNLIEAMNQIWIENENFYLLISGSFYSKHQKILLETALHEKKIIFLGNLSQADLRLAYEACDAAVYPSLCEGFGRACLEAMYCGLPLACSNLDVFKEVAGNYPNYFNPKDIVSIKSSIHHAAFSKRKTRVYLKKYQPSSIRNQFFCALNKVKLDSKKNAINK
jgi:glycosyltransferase involved in cell wall biosynthesis